MLPFGPDFFFETITLHSQLGRCIKVLSQEHSARLPYTAKMNNPAEFGRAVD
jgi:hypothetical protein